MTGQMLEQLSRDFLTQLFPDTVISLLTTGGVQTTTSRSPGRLSFKLEGTDSYRVAFQRERDFTPDEERLVQTFLDYIKSKISLIDNPSFGSILKNQFSEMIGMFIAGDNRILAEIVDKFITLSDTTYEGRKISLSCIVDLEKNGTGLTYVELLDSKSGSVLSNGMDTVLAVGKNGKVSGFKYCDAGLADKDAFVPIRYMPIGAMTDQTKVAVILNKNDEILVLQNNSLVFSRRRGRWQYYQADVLYKNICFEENVPHSFVRQGTFATTLDISFARSGGCIAVIADDQMANFVSFLSAQNASDRAFLDEEIVKKYFKKTFHLEPRQIRAEICGIDGAVILNQKGELLYSGKIVPVQVTSAVGARTAAAKTLANFGVGIKVSMDGMVEVYGLRSGSVVKIQSYC